MMIIMKKALLIVSITVLCLSIGCSQVARSENSSGSGSIQFETLEHDFGAIPQGGDGTFEFVFKNTGEQPLLLNNVRSSCGCTVPEWPKEPIGKGEKASIKVSYNTRITGSFTKSIAVYTNTGDKPVTLVIKGNVEAAAE